MDELLKKVKSSNLLVLGDINIDILSNSNDSDKYLFLMSSYGLKSLVNEPTRITDDTQTCIDHVFTRFHKNWSHKVSCEILDLKITDHCMLNLRIDQLTVSKLNRYIPFPVKYKTDYLKLVNALKFEFWEQVYVKSNPSSAYDAFLKILKGHIDNSTTVQSRVNIKLKRLRPWIGEDLLKIINRKNSLRKKFQKNPQNNNLKRHYHKINKKVKRKLAISREKYYSVKFENCKGNVKEEWKVVNGILNNEKIRDSIYEIEVDNLLIRNPMNIANNFNSYFASVAENSKPNPFQIDCGCDLYPEITEDAFQINSFVFQSISPLELYKRIMNLNNKKSCTSDGITNCLLKRIAFFIVDVLCYLFNMSVNCGIFPSALKVAEVIPLYKKGCRRSVSQYRPISLLPTFSKLFEKIMKDRILSFLNKNNFLCYQQFGFREGKSTEDAILKLCSEICDGFNNNNSPIALFIDMTKAFDMVNHTILLDKLYKAGFRDSMFNWFNSYLSGRFQRVKLNGVFSDELELRTGVPQGSVLGPILFLIYINSIFKQNLNSNVTAFADDMAFTYINNSLFESMVKLETDLQLLRQWFAKHELIVSDKTKLMLFNLKNSNLVDSNVVFHSAACPKMSLFAHNCGKVNFCRDVSCCSNCFKIESVECFKYLGVSIDTNLNWKTHASVLKKYMMCATRKMFLLQPHCSKKLLTVIYYGLVNSKLQYGLTSWGGAYMNTIEPLLIAQKHIVRIISKKNRLTSSWPIFCSLRILPIKHLYVYKVLKVFFMRSGYSTILRNSNVYGLRVNSQHLVNVPISRKTHFSNFYTVSAPTIFNRLPYEIRIIKIKNLFLNNVKKWLFTMDSSEVKNLFMSTF